jgi:hypothetical protein
MSEIEDQSDVLTFKGMRRYRYNNPDLLLNEALRSPFYWWWAYLRLSKDYWWLCQRDGQVADTRLREMYWDFGRVYEMTFADWWQSNGIHVFKEQVALPAVREIDVRTKNFSKPISNYLMLELPLHMTERTLIKQVRQKLRDHPNREVRRISSASRPLAKFVGIRQDVIESAYAVWQVHYKSRDHRQVDKIGQAHGTKSLYQIGKELRLVKTCMPSVTDNKERAAKRVNGMKVAVSRMLTRANNLIDNACIGVFPSIKPISEPVVWRGRRKEELMEAELEGKWRPLFDANETLIV